jgi:hypothetical protein
VASVFREDRAGFVVCGDLVQKPDVEFTMQNGSGRMPAGFGVKCAIERAGTGAVLAWSRRD